MPQGIPIQGYQQMPPQGAPYAQGLPQYPGQQQMPISQNSTNVIVVGNQPAQRIVYLRRRRYCAGFWMVFWIWWIIYWTTIYN